MLGIPERYVSRGCTKQVAGLHICRAGISKTSLRAWGSSHMGWWVHGNPGCLTLGWNANKIW